jgi:hypothetical protein
VLVTCRAMGKVSGPADIGRLTLIAFTQGRSYRKRIEQWLGSANVMPERILEFASYQAMIACVAAGTGFAVVPKSVLEALRATKSIRQHALPKRFSHNRTYVVWSGDPSPSLHGQSLRLATRPPSCSPRRCSFPPAVAKSAPSNQRNPNFPLAMRRQISRTCRLGKPMTAEPRVGEIGDLISAAMIQSSGLSRQKRSRRRV